MCATRCTTRCSTSTHTQPSSSFLPTTCPRRSITFARACDAFRLSVFGSEGDGGGVGGRGGQSFRAREDVGDAGTSGLPWLKRLRARTDWGLAGLGSTGEGEGVGGVLVRFRSSRRGRSVGGTFKQNWRSAPRTVCQDDASDASGAYLELSYGMNSEGKSTSTYRFVEVVVTENLDFSSHYSVDSP